MVYHLSFVTFPPQFSQKLIDFLLLLFRLSSLNMIVAILVFLSAHRSVIFHILVFWSAHLLWAAPPSSLWRLSTVEQQEAFNSSPPPPATSALVIGILNVLLTRVIFSTILVRIVVVHSLKTIALFTHHTPPNWPPQA